MGVTTMPMKMVRSNCSTIFIGIVVTPIRYVLYCLRFHSTCKKLNFKPEFKLGVLFPTVVGLSVFVVGIILGSIL